jgi:hypothetical protein
MLCRIGASDDPQDSRRQSEHEQHPISSMCASTCAPVRAPIRRWANSVAMTLRLPRATAV